MLIHAVLLHLYLAISVVASEYKERLDLRILPESAFLATFDFKSNTSLAAFENQDYRLFPRSLGQILRHTGTKELHLRFTVGRWDSGSWGPRPRHGTREGGTGVELWAWIDGHTDEEANTRWLMLTNALSGLFCASMNFIDSTKTIRPQLTFDREGTNGTENLHLLHGALPHEVVCTENLTPLLKLLPCKGKVGISSLLDGHKLFDATWQSMAIDVRPVCQDGQCQVEIQQTVDMVLDADRASRPSKDPIPRPPPIENIACNLLKPYNTDDTCFPELAHGKRPWSVSQVFGRSIHGSCPLGMTEEPEVHVHAPPDREVKVNCTGEFKQREQAYNLPSTAAFDLEINSGPDESIQLDRPRLYAERTFTGPGQETGGVHAVLTNPSTEDLDVVYLESLPWFMRVYIHTLRVRVTSSDAQPTEAAIEDMVYRPAVDRVRGSQLELRMAVPAKSTLTLTYDFEKAILRYTEYPPDANRGFDVAPAVIRILPNGRGGESQYVRTTSLLLPLPTPDFSMPYNVIILTSTVIAMGFGSMFNLIVRRFVAADEVGVAGLAAVKARLRARLSAVRARFGASAAQKKLQ